MTTPDGFTPHPPGSTIGVFGSGQLGRMLALAARPMGYRIHVYSPEANSPTAPVADREWVAAYTDHDQVAEFAKSVDVITLEFENVPTEALETAAQFAPVRPGKRVLSVTQHRGQEKSLAAQLGLPTTPFRIVHSAQELEAAVADLGSVIAKTTTDGYDGKGQARIQDGSPEACSAAWDRLSAKELIAEQVVDFSFEFSVIGARSPQGEIACYDPIENDHRNHILDVSVSPCSQAAEIGDRAKQTVQTLLEALEVEGLLTVEFFATNAGEILINEMAPRPHNSGHLTIEGHTTSQFEQQLRAICGLRLGSTHQRQPAAMVNLLGDLWTAGTPDWPGLLEQSEARLHLYGKRQPKPGRKMGHLTCLASDAQSAAAQALAARERLTLSAGMSAK